MDGRVHWAGLALHISRVPAATLALLSSPGTDEDDWETGNDSRQAIQQDSGSHPEPPDPVLLASEGIKFL